MKWRNSDFLAPDMYLRREAAACWIGTSSSQPKAASEETANCLNRMPRFSFKKLVKSRLWILSVLIGLIGIFAYMAALKYEAISLVQPMLSISIVITVVIGRLMFDERIRKDRWLYITLIIAGVFLLSV